MTPTVLALITVFMVFSLLILALCIKYYKKISTETMLIVGSTRDLMTVLDQYITKNTDLIDDNTELLAILREFSAHVEENYQQQAYDDLYYELATNEAELATVVEDLTQQLDKVCKQKAYTHDNNLQDLLKYIQLTQDEIAQYLATQGVLLNTIEGMNEAKQATNNNNTSGG